MGITRENLVAQVNLLQEELDDLVENEASFEREIAFLQEEISDAEEDEDFDLVSDLESDLEYAEDRLLKLSGEIATLDEELVEAQDALEEHDVDGDVDE